MRGEKENRSKCYENEVRRLQEYALTRMGHPYTGPVRGYFTDSGWEVDHESPHKLVDTSVLGILPGSIADTYINNSGSPYTKSQLIQRAVKSIEVDLLNILSEFFGYPSGSIRGYVTSGATEGNLSCLWWLRESLLKGRDEGEVYLFMSDHTHYSINKVCNMLQLKVVSVPASEDGSIDIEALEKKIAEVSGKNKNCKFIFSFNVGTTELGGIDDIPAICSMIKTLQNEFGFEYRTHVDAALLGLAIPILNIFGTQSIFEYVDTLVFSGHKLLGTLSISGVALAKARVWEEAFHKHKLTVDYVVGIEDCTVLGSRSGYSVIEFHHALCSLDIDTDSNNFKKLLKTCLKNARYLSENLRNIVHDNVTHVRDMFTVTFPSPGINDKTIDFLRKYGLMKVRENRLGVCVLAHVNQPLIDKFLKEYKTYVSEIK